MRLVLTAFALTTLVTLSGCATSASNRIAAPDAADDPAYTPPGQVNLTIHSASSSATPPAAKGAAMAAPQPNKTQIRSRSIRAAMY